LSSDEFFLFTLQPRESKQVYTKEELLPDRIRAIDDVSGDVVFDRTFTWAEVRDLGFLVVIRTEDLRPGGR
jgi:hypothetical protein